jgi:hypothetical protein
MFIPLKDENPTARFPYATILLIGLNALIFFAQLFSPLGLQASVLKTGAIPYEITHFHALRGLPVDRISPILALVVSMFVHGAFSTRTRSRGTPRIANRLLRRVRDYAEVKVDGRITRPVAVDALAMMDVDIFGFDEIDRKLMLTILEKFNGGPVGVGSLAAAISEDEDSIEDIYEPYLIQIGFIERTPRGRMVTSSAAKHVGRVFNPEKKSGQETLFR